MVLDPDASIESGAFVNLWESLPVTAEFSCNVVLIDARQRTVERSMQAITQHLQDGGYFVVAAGKHPPGDIVKIYAFACGYDDMSKQLSRYKGSLSSPAKVKPTLCLLEMVIETAGNVTLCSDGSYNNMESEGEWKFHCQCKATEEKKSAFFVGELNLGDLFMLT